MVRASNRVCVSLFNLECCVAQVNGCFTYLLDLCWLMLKNFRHKLDFVVAVVSNSEIVIVGLLYTVYPQFLGYIKMGNTFKSNSCTVIRFSNPMKQITKELINAVSIQLYQTRRLLSGGTPIWWWLKAFRNKIFNRWKQEQLGSKFFPMHMHIFFF